MIYESIEFVLFWCPVTPVNIDWWYITIALSCDIYIYIFTKINKDIIVDNDKI